MTSEAYGVLHPDPTAATKKYRLVATEEAISVPEQIEAMKKVTVTSNEDNADLEMWRRFLQDTPFATRIRRRLLDIGDERLQIMDETGVAVHLLSMTSPG